MGVNISLCTDLDKEIDRVKELIELLEKAGRLKECISFITIKNFMELRNVSSKTAQEIFNMPDFPSENYGKEKVVEVHALIEWYKVPRRK